MRSALAVAFYWMPMVGVMSGLDAWMHRSQRSFAGVEGRIGVLWLVGTPMAIVLGYVYHRFNPDVMGYFVPPIRLLVRRWPGIPAWNAFIRTLMVGCLVFHVACIVFWLITIGGLLVR
ncbi:MAG: hypothetical protein KGJ62_02975 [Armatimonadetes bacterium]|nr:hypothetical protein [Armatimonadota bacterium]